MRSVSARLTGFSCLCVVLCCGHEALFLPYGKLDHSEPSHRDWQAMWVSMEGFPVTGADLGCGTRARRKSQEGGVRTGRPGGGSAVGGCSAVSFLECPTLSQPLSSTWTFRNPEQSISSFLLQAFRWSELKTSSCSLLCGNFRSISAKGQVSVAVPLPKDVDIAPCLCLPPAQAGAGCPSSRFVHLAATAWDLIQCSRTASGHDPDPMPLPPTTGTFPVSIQYWSSTN